MQWLKAFHVIAMVTWFAGLFYLPRLFVYHADTTDAPGLQRFAIMERRLFLLMSIGGVATVSFGITMLISAPDLLAMGWLRVKLVLVALLVAYHYWCLRHVRAFAAGCNAHSSKWFRLFNELPSVLLVAIVLLAILQPF